MKATKSKLGEDNGPTFAQHILQNQLTSQGRSKGDSAILNPGNCKTLASSQIEASVETFAYHLLHDEQYPFQRRPHHLKDNYVPSINLPQAQSPLQNDDLIGSSSYAGHYLHPRLPNK